VARLASGPSPLRPKVEPLPTEVLDGPARERLRVRLDGFVAAELQRALGPLLRLAEAAEQTGAGRGLVFRLEQGLGTLRRDDAEDLLASLDRGLRRRLTRLGLRIGRDHVWIAGVLTPAAIRARAMLWALQARRPAPELPKAGRKLMPAQAALSDEFYRAIGYRRAGAHALRIDAYEALGDAVHALARGGPFAATARLKSMAGGASPLAAALVALGARAEPQPDGTALYRLRRRAPSGRRGIEGGKRRAHSPFASLGDLWGGK
jgi:ATP-dependent RNA helicase SUPV3L1/SUV3